MATIDVCIEAGKRRVFASAIHWPGWSRSGRDEEAALEALVGYGDRYAAVLKDLRLGFRPPRTGSGLDVVERAHGDATTDFGAPSIAARADADPMDAEELRRRRRVLQACWAAFDRTATAAAGRRLAKGPRGGGRDLEAIVGHVVGAEGSYVRKLAAKAPPMDEKSPMASVDREREVVLDALARAVNEGLPKRGPRGGALWLPRYFVRRAAWHVLDHAWEIEDRMGDRPRGGSR